ncbi:hypothetical protein MTO96_046198, partial [Rhipicephalus appendiculatus]
RGGGGLSPRERREKEKRSKGARTTTLQLIAPARRALCGDPDTARTLLPAQTRNDEERKAEEAKRKRVSPRRLIGARARHTNGEEAARQPASQPLFYYTLPSVATDLGATTSTD